MTTYNLTNVFLASDFVDEFGDPYPANGTIGAFQISAAADVHSIAVNDDDGYLQDNSAVDATPGTNTQSVDTSEQTLATAFNGVAAGGSIISRLTLEVIVTTPAGLVIRGEAVQLWVGPSNQTAYAFQFDVPAGSTVEVLGVGGRGDTLFSDLNTTDNPMIDFEYNQIIDYSQFTEMVSNGGAAFSAADIQSMIVKDNDAVLEDTLYRGEETVDQNAQGLAVAFDGHAVGSAVRATGYYDVLNTDTGQTGRLYALQVLDDTDPSKADWGGQAVGGYYAFSNDFKVADGDHITRTSGQNVLGNVEHTRLFADDSGQGGGNLPAGVSQEEITDGDPDYLVRTLGENLIVNGDFEQHANTGVDGVWYYGAGELLGWDLGWKSKTLEVQVGEYAGRAVSGNASGNSILEIDAIYGVWDGVSQTVTVDEAGTYQMSFDYGIVDYNGTRYLGSDINSNAFRLFIDGEIAQVVGSGIDYHHQSGFQYREFELELSAGEHLLEFREWNFNDGRGALLDNVELRYVDHVYETGVVRGESFYDTDGDGVRDDNEGGIGGQTVYLLDANGNDVLDADGQSITTRTGPNGEYEFAGLDEGQYRVGFVDDRDDVQYANVDRVLPDGSEMRISEVFDVDEGMQTTGVDQGIDGVTVSRTIEVCENEPFVKDFNTTCNLISEDVYFLVDEPVCATVGWKPDDVFAHGWGNHNTVAPKYHVFLDKPASTDLTFTIVLTTDPDDLGVYGRYAAPPGFGWLTTQPNEFDAPHLETLDVVVKAGETQSEPFYVGTEQSHNYSFGIKIESVYNHDLDDECRIVSVVFTTPVAIDLNRDGEIGVTGESSSADKAGLALGETVHFDMNADGEAERIEWFDGSGDGILIDNRDGAAATDMDGSRLFGDDGGTYAHGYAKLLAQFDGNGDGVVDGAELNGLELWVDDGDAVVEDGELQTLQAHSITQISGGITTELDDTGRELLRSTVSQDFEATGNVTYSLEGPDADLFTVDAQGVVTFINAPDYENPLDEGGDNVYNITLVRNTDDPTCAPARENLRIEVSNKPSLGDTVWYDTNRNGRLDNAEVGAAGITVKLLDAAGEIVAVTTTDANGTYLFEDLVAGDYQVMFVAPNGYEFTTQSPDSPETANNDSDADSNGMTGVITLAEGEDQLNIDAGLVGPGTASLGDTVWYDTDKDGVRDSGEAGASGVTVKLFNAAGIVATTTTDASGNYLFENLDAGDYQVMFTTPDGYAFTTPSTVAADAVNDDSDANSITGMTGTVSLSVGEAERDVDAGLVALNGGPDAVDDAAKTCADEAKSVAVLLNDTDADGDSLTITSVAGQAIAEGQTILAADGVAITLNGGELVFDASGTGYADALIGTSNSASYSYTISDGDGGTDTADIDMTFCGGVNTLETIAESLPDTGNMFVTLDTTFDGDFFEVSTSLTGDDRFDGMTFDQAYCISIYDPIQQGADIAVNFYLATEDDVPDGVLPAEDNLDAINWILNQDFDSIDNGDGTGETYTQAEIQGAIWGLTDNIVFVSSDLGTSENAQEIFDLALTSGEGFEAGEGDIVGVILDPTAEAEANGSIQPFIIGVEFDDLAQDCLCL